ncbi:hypothetical protein [Azospirillum sp. ST 5-10]|uniref:hypothetical protein n=1 Tax=Azospirillum sp. ST 5-10 TaxID=3445776 RepID=UPI003F4A5B4E
MVIHIIRPTRAAVVVAEVLGAHRPALRVSELHRSQQDHATIGRSVPRISCATALPPSRQAMRPSPRMKALFLRVFALARRRHALAPARDANTGKGWNAISAPSSTSYAGSRSRHRV